MAETIPWWQVSLKVFFRHFTLKKVMCKINVAYCSNSGRSASFAPYYSPPFCLVHRLIPDSTGCRTFFRVTTPEETAEAVLARKVSGVIAALPHSTEKQPCQDQQPDTLQYRNSPDPEDFWHEPVPKQLNSHA